MPPDTVSAYIEAQEAPHRVLLQHLRQFILDVHPDITETLRHGVPFFDYFGMMCYLNPVKKGIDICFVKGFELMDEAGILEDRGRKMVKSVIYEDTQCNQEGVLLATLHEAMHLNQMHAEIRDLAKQLSGQSKMHPSRK
jgi:hypothetical protein